MSFFYFHFWTIALLHVGFLVDSFDFEYIGNVISLLSDLHYFWWEFTVYFLGIPYKQWVIFLFLLSRFTPCLWLSPFLLWLVYLWISLHLSYEFVELPWCVMSSNIFGKLFLQTHVFALVSVSFPGVHIVCVLVYFYCLIFLWVSVYFSSFLFSLCFSDCTISINLF